MMATSQSQSRNFTDANLGKPKLSVVVGSNNARHSIQKCLRELITQRNGQNVEIIIVDNSTDGTGEIVIAQFPEVTLVRCEANKLMPELWEIGMRQAAGDIVAITTSHFVPAKNWIKEILKAHENSSPAIGGAIENDPSAGAVAWAVYFCRYSPYMLPFKEKTVDDFAGDNASYKHWALERFQESWRNGFWESFVHAEMRKEGLQLLVSPNILVYHQKSFDLAGFIKQRFWHGRQFGSERAHKLSTPKRLLYILLSPLIPFIFMVRIARRVLDKGRHTGQFIVSLPALTLFLLSWAAGELSGYLWMSENEN